MDEDGRERLDLIDGKVPSVPYPPWCQSDAALASIAEQTRLGWQPADRPARLRLVADAYGLARDGRTDLHRDEFAVALR